MAESRDRSSSTEPQLKFPGCSHYRRRSDNHFRCQQCRLNEGLTLCTQEAPCDVCKDWLPEAWQALERAVQHKRKHKAAAATKAVKKSQEMDDSIEIHAREEGLQVPPVKRKDDESSKKLDSTKRADSATSSTSKAMEADSVSRPSRSRDKKKTLSSSVSVVWRSRSDGGPVPSGTKGSERHRSRSGDRGRRSHRSERLHDSPRSLHSPRRRRSGERAWPTSSSGGSSSRSRQADSTDAPGPGRASGRAMEFRPSSSSTHHQCHHSRSSGDRRSLSSEKSGSFYVSRRQVQLSPVVPQATEKRTISVIPSPPRPAGMDESKRWHVFRVRSHHFSTYMMHLFRDKLLPATIISHLTSVASVLRHWDYDPAADLHIKLLIRAFRLERPVQRRIMQVGPSSCAFIFIETTIRIRVRYSRGILWRRHSFKMADHENCVPVSIGFSETALIHSCIECCSRQVCVREREHPTSTPGISFAGTWFPCEESTTVTGSGVDLPSQPVRSRECCALSGS